MNLKSYDVGLPELPPELLEKIKPIRLVVFDVDGTLTDGAIVFNEPGETKYFNVQDGAGLKFLMQAGLQVAFLSSRRSSLVDRRAAELGVQHVVQGCENKRLETELLQARLHITLEETAAMGDDLPDLRIFSCSGLRLAPADAVPEILSAADWITRRKAGYGAAREVIELILKVQGHWDNIVAGFINA